MRKLLLIVSLLAVLSATPALAITDGELDRNGHPQVGLMVAFGVDPDSGEYGPLWRCSGTLISPTVYVTAGHCTERPADAARVWFDADMRDHPRYPDSGGVRGTTHTHPDYYSGPWWLADVGVVVLDRPVRGVPYASLPAEDALDRFASKAKKNKAWFTAVGYGLQKAYPLPASWKDVAERIRMVSYPKLIQINVKGSTGRKTLLLSNNANTGGTCFGDSGGPNFLKTRLVIAGVTSFGKNPTCAGQGGVFRLDRADAREWVLSFLD